MKFDEFFKGQTDILKAQSEVVGNINHRTSIGSNRETFVKEFLSKFFPKKFVVGSGEIFDSSNNVTNQCDVVIYNEQFPIFDYSSTQQFLAEGVLAHIEVKSNLTTEELIKSLNITKSVKMMERNVGSKNNPKISSCIFAYKGISKETLMKAHKEYYASEGDFDNFVDIICVLGEYIIAKQNVPGTPGKIIGYETKDRTLSLFFIQLYQFLLDNTVENPNLIKYINLPRFKMF